MRLKRRANHRADDDQEQEPLMDDEITRSQEGVAEGDFRLGTSSLVSSSAPLKMKNKETIL